MDILDGFPLDYSPASPRPGVFGLFDPGVLHFQCLEEGTERRGEAVVRLNFRDEECVAVRGNESARPFI